MFQSKLEKPHLSLMWLNKNVPNCDEYECILRSTSKVEVNSKDKGN